MAISVQSSPLKGDANLIKELKNRYWLVGFDIRTDDVDNELRLESDEESEADGEMEDAPPLLSGYPLAFLRSRYPSDPSVVPDDVDEYKWADVVEQNGTEGFHAFLQEIAGIIHVPVLVLTLRHETDEPYSGAEVFSIQPESKRVLHLGEEWGDFMTRGDLTIRSNLFAKVDNRSRQTSKVAKSK